MSYDMLMEEKNVNHKILNGISNAHSILKIKNKGFEHAKVKV